MDLAHNLKELKVCTLAEVILDHGLCLAFFSRCAGILPLKLPSKDGSLVSFVSSLVSN